jgi:hypothetical protein
MRKDSLEITSGCTAGVIVVFGRILIAPPFSHSSIFNEFSRQYAGVMVIASFILNQ